VHNFLEQYPGKEQQSGKCLFAALFTHVNTSERLWWLLRISVRKMSDFAFDFCIFSELGHSQMDDRGSAAAA
jgi:hypothetical protein